MAHRNNTPQVCVSAGEHNILANKTIVWCDTSEGEIHLTLPPHDRVPDGRLITIKDTSGQATNNHINIKAAGDIPVENEAAIAIASNYGAVTLGCNGHSWFIMSAV